MAYYGRYDDDAAPGAEEITSSTEDADPDYAIANVVLDMPAQPGRLADTTGWILFRFATKKQIIAAALIYAYLTEGLDVRLQANDTDDFSTPAVDVAFTIPPKRRDGPSYQPWTTNPWVRVGTLPDPDGYLYWRIYFPEANDQVISVGKVMLMVALRQVELFHEAADPGEQEYDPAAFLDQRTELNVRTVEAIGGPQRLFTGALVATDLDAGTPPVQEAADFRALMQSAEGSVHPWLWIPFEDEVRINDACLVQSETPTWERTHKIGGYQVFPFALREVSRGVPFP